MSKMPAKRKEERKFELREEEFEEKVDQVIEKLDGVLGADLRKGKNAYTTAKKLSEEVSMSSISITLSIQPFLFIASASSQEGSETRGKVMRHSRAAVSA